MDFFKNIWVKIALVIAVLVIGWNVLYPTDSFRYKVTVSVETPEGIKTGSAVREFTVQQQPEVGDSGPGNSVRGEAVVVDLGNRGILFATIDADDEYLVFNTFRIEAGLTHKGMSQYERLEAKAPLDPVNYPLLVGFKDMDDPKSVTVAYRPILERDKNKPGLQYKVADVEDNLEELYGKGVNLQSITIEMTDEPVTWGVEKYLPWLGYYHNRRFDNNDSAAVKVGGPLKSWMSAGSFTTENFK